jgi:hypothetical protein
MVKMNDNTFLVTFHDNELGCYSYNWYKTEEEMREDIDKHPEWSDFEAGEILRVREIEI